MDKKRKESEITKENDKTFLKDGMSTTDIRKTVKHIREYLDKGGSVPIEERINQIKIDHAFFVERYPMLFEMCIRSDFNNDYLNYFLNMRDKIINDSISSEEASKQVGKEWFNQFVDTSKLPKK